MNRFRTKKKAKDDFVVPRPSGEAESSGFSRMFGGKAKKSYEEPKPEIDLATALPASDDFRTSLLMNGLSARFSMLREQDDPNSKIGKASDDSVLFPKRQSRMDLGFRNDLHDIIEVESIRAPQLGRFDSYNSDDAASMSGSIMSRAKPTDGNNLFGGRQKIYKISTSGASKNGALSGRALYDDDVSLSAFQKWRQTEKERTSVEEEREQDAGEAEPAVDFSRRRETNSTISSMPSAARNSTAATSIMSSQPAQSLKDWRPPSGVGQPPERSVTRTRRLYEQGLTQDLYDHQSSALSRMDTLSKRSLGTRTPDLTPTIPSPTISSFADRPLDRRQILSKGSAPNLRSFSPTAIGPSPVSPTESNSKFLNFERSYTATPPLSPPISESEDPAALAIGPNDHGKATAMGVFARPSQPYDDSRYAQRQRQMQQGRETPTNRFRTESNASQPTTRSRSSSSIKRSPFEKPDMTTPMTEPLVEEVSKSPTTSHPEAPMRQPPVPIRMTESSEGLVRPDFRRSAVPTPLSVSSRNSMEALVASGQSKPGSRDDDSPTLGPPSGLSGMVRQHLRNVSTASSVYGPGPAEGEFDGPMAGKDANAQLIRQLDFDTNEWTVNENDWNLSYGDGDQIPEPDAESAHAPPQMALPVAEDTIKEDEVDSDQEEFARQLAEGARRVRERFTSYVESDSGPSSPTTSPHVEPFKDLAPPRASAFGLLRKSSRASLADREPIKEEPTEADSSSRFGARKEDGHNMPDQHAQPEKEEKVHAGLKAFRQARRELQRMKEADVQSRRRNGLPPENAEVKQPDVQGAKSLHPIRTDSVAKHRPNGTQSNDELLSPRIYQPGRESAVEAVPRLHASTTSPDKERRRPPPMNPGGTPLHGSFRTELSPTPYYGSPRPSPGFDGIQGSPRLGNGPHALPISSPVSFNGYPSSRSTSVSQMNSALSTPSLHSTASTPNLHAGMSAPPLPPINPRRKVPSGDLESPAVRSPFRTSPDRSAQRQNALVMPDNELGPDQYRQRLRKVPSETGELDGRVRQRSSPPRPTRPSPPRAMMTGPSPNLANGSHGGMI